MMRSPILIGLIVVIATGCASIRAASTQSEDDERANEKARQCINWPWCNGYGG